MCTNILLIDDDEEILSSLKRYLTLKNYSVTTCNNPNDGLAKIKSENIQIVITDINMPEMDGIELLKTIKELGQFIHVIMMTGDSTMNKVVTCLEFGAEDFIVKPFKDFELVDNIIAASDAKRKRWIKSMKESCKK